MSLEIEQLRLKIERALSLVDQRKASIEQELLKLQENSIRLSEAFEAVKNVDDLLREIDADSVVPEGAGHDIVSGRILPESSTPEAFTPDQGDSQSNAFNRWG